MKNIYIKRIMIVSFIFFGMYYVIRNMLFKKEKIFDLDIDGFNDYVHLPTGEGLTMQHALHFYEVFMDILLNTHNRFPGHAENVLLLNYILRNDVKWRTTETALFRIFDATGNDQINKRELDSFINLFPRVSDQRLISSFINVIDRNIDTKIVKVEWFNFCNKQFNEKNKQKRKLRPKLLQDLQEWEQSKNQYLGNPKNISAQFTTTEKKYRNHKDLIFGQLDRAMDMMSEDFGMFINHWEHRATHSVDDPDMFVRRMGYWILNRLLKFKNWGRFERWDSLYMWIYQILDDNGDGNLIPKEVDNQFKVFGVSQIHVKEIFMYLDEDGDGIIEREEWHDWSETIRRLLQTYFKKQEPKMDQYQ